MTLQEMRRAKGYSQSELARQSGINLRSLQDYEQGHKSIISAKGETLYRLSRALDCSIEKILSGNSSLIEFTENNTDQTINRMMSYEAAIKKRREAEVHFPVIIADKAIDMSRIYPTKQQTVKKVVDALRREDTLEKLILFGSSITMACNKDSDLDFGVGTKENSLDSKNRISLIIQEACDWGADILWLDRLNAEERVYQDIMKGLRLI